MLSLIRVYKVLQNHNQICFTIYPKKLELQSKRCSFYGRISPNENSGAALMETTGFINSPLF